MSLTPSHAHTPPHGRIRIQYFFACQLVFRISIFHFSSFFAFSRAPHIYRFKIFKIFNCSCRATWKKTDACSVCCEQLFLSFGWKFCLTNEVLNGIRQCLHARRSGKMVGRDARELLGGREAEAYREDKSRRWLSWKSKDELEDMSEMHDDGGGKLRVNKIIWKQVTMLSCKGKIMLCEIYSKRILQAQHVKLYSDIFLSFFFACRLPSFVVQLSLLLVA